MMLNILWIEDEATDEKKNQWFKNRPVELINDFSLAEQAINSDLNRYDVVVLDINLENSEQTESVEKYAASLGVPPKEFLIKSGINLYFILLENGFPKERILFLTANANNRTSQVNDLKQAFECGDDERFDKIIGEITNSFGEKEKSEISQFLSKSDGCSADDIGALCSHLESLFYKVNEGESKNTYEELCKAAKECRIISVPMACQKGTDQLDIELKKHEENKYFVLRRGVIEGCNYLELSTINPELKEFFFGLKKYLPLKEPPKNEKQSIYLHLVRAIVHDWHDTGHNIPNRKTDPVGCALGYLLRTTRNWLAHDSLLSNFDERTIAFLFLINIRMLANLADAPVADFEYKLLSIFTKSKESESDIICNRVVIMNKAL